MAYNFEVRYFSYGPKCKNAKNGQNCKFFVEKPAVYTKLKKNTNIVTYVFLSRPSTEKKKLKN